MSTAIHITHEATHKIGGIGTVLHGLLTARAYQKGISRSILVGPWSLGSSPDTRLGVGGRVLYSLCDGIDEDSKWRSLFRSIEDKYQVWITYGVRRFADQATGVSEDIEVLLVETSGMDRGRLNYFKSGVFQRFGIASGNYESYGDYELWLSVAEPAYEAVMALVRAKENTAQEPVYFLAHEHMGMPTALKAAMEREPNVYTILYAHETATIRPHVEGHPGHDTRFYNLMAKAREQGLYIESVLGNQWHSYRHALIDRAQFCDAVFAVGDLVQEEFYFLSPAFTPDNVFIVYNGIPAFEVKLDEKKASKEKLVRYAENLLGYRPDYVFTHVTRMVLSKGLWRDIRVLHHLDPYLAEAGKSAVLFVLSSEIGTGRPPHDVRRMEAEYGWPRIHREGYPDLVGLEVGFQQHAAALNSRAKATQVVFVNQFGWDRERCGERMPEDMNFMDIRIGSDAEFGLSIYEPFGIAQVEPLSFGAICLITNVCGCVGFTRKAAKGKDVPNVLIADYLTLSGGATSLSALSQIGWAERDFIETSHSAEVARDFFPRLPKTDAEVEAMIRRGHDIAEKMSWEVVVNDYFLPGLEKARKRRK